MKKMLKIKSCQKGYRLKTRNLSSRLKLKSRNKIQVEQNFLLFANFSKAKF